MQDPKNRHLGTITQLCRPISLHAHIDNRKKNLLNSTVTPKCPHNIVNFGLLAAKICWRVWGTLANFSWFRVLAVLLYGTLVVGVSQNLRCWTEGATYIWQGGHHVGHWPTFLALVMFSCCWISLISSLSWQDNWQRTLFSRQKMWLSD